MAYNGGKAGAGTVQRIINRMPPHQVYIEPFLGAGAVLRTKRPAAENIGIELDPAVIAAHWRDPPQALTVIGGDGLHSLRERLWRGGKLAACRTFRQPNMIHSGRIAATPSMTRTDDQRPADRPRHRRPATTFGPGLVA